METKKIEQKWLIWNSKFGKHFYALALGLAIVLSGWLYFFVSAEYLDIATNLLNTHQTIGRVQITSDGTNDWTPFIDLNWFSQKAIFKNIAKWDVVKKLWINLADELVYEEGWLVDDGDRVIDGDDIYRVTWHVSIWTNVAPVWKFNVVSSAIGLPELYIEQTTDSASNIRMKNNSSMMWSIWVYASWSNQYYYVGSTWTALFRVYDNWTTSIDWDLYIISGHSMHIWNWDINLVWNIDVWNWNINNANIVTAVAFVMSSDKDKKENIEKIKNPLDKIYQLNGYTFDRKKEWVLDWRKHDVWVLAQEVEKVLPELVHVDSNGHKWVQYANMVALLIEWIKELWNKMDSLYDKYLDQQSKIDSLEERIKILESKLN